MDDDKKAFNSDLVLKYIINNALRKKSIARNNTLYLQMNVTNRCTEKCKQCYLRNKTLSCNKEAEISEFIDILEQFQGVAKKESKNLIVDLIGGDPLSRPDIFVILEYLSERKIDYGIKGNPYLLFDNLKLLKKLNLRRYQMSLDGLEKTHDMLRSINSYKKTISAIKLLNKENIPVNIKYTISEKNHGDLWPLLYELYENDIRITAFSVARYFKQNEKGFHVSKEYYDKAFAELSQFYRMQIENKDIRIHINLKEHLWIPYLLQKEYILKDYINLIEKNPYLSSCSMISSNSTFITSDGCYDVCPKILHFKKTKNLGEYMKEKEKFLEEIKSNSCLECTWKKFCMGCLAFHTNGSNRRDCDCFLFNCKTKCKC